MTTTMRVARFFVLLAAVCGLVLHDGKGADAANPVGCYAGDYGSPNAAFYFFFDGAQWTVLVTETEGRPVGYFEDKSATKWISWDNYTAQTGIDADNLYQVDCVSGYYWLQGYLIKFENGQWTIRVEHEGGFSAWAPLEDADWVLDILDGETVVLSSGGGSSTGYSDAQGQVNSDTAYMNCININDSNVDYDHDDKIGMGELQEYCSRHL